MEKLHMQSADGVQVNIEKIASLFPDCVTETIVGYDADDKPILRHKLDFEKLQQNLSSEIISGKEERYQFTWPDKKKAILLANSPINATLRPCRDESVDFDNTKNLYIEGDNLDVLKCLKETYLHKVKMIYIDPPYNTGKDFVYEDKFAESASEYLANSGQFDEQGRRLVTNTENNGRFHTVWLNMIYPRLKVARDLLTDDGVIFISIDDHEVDNLKKVCNEIFGADNFLCNFPRVTKKGGKSSSEVARNHDYVLVYTKNRALSDLCGIGHNDEGYSCKDEFFEKRGYYKANQTLDYDSLGYVKTLDYPVVIDDETFYPGGDKQEFEKRQTGMHGRADWGWRWRWSKELYEFGYNNGFIEVHRGGDRPRIYTKTYQKVKIEKVGKCYKIVEFERTKPLSTLEFTDNKYSNDNAKKILDSILKKGIFEYTKPPVLIEMCMKLISDKDFTVLDFFSGSATTAHAVMQLNAEDGGNRQYIMVQLPEATDEKSEAYKAGYKTICEIGKERIRRAGKKIKEDNPLTTQNLDTGFRVLKLDSSNMQDVYYSPADTTQSNIFNLVDNVKEDRTPEDLLFQVMLELGATLDSKIDTTSIEGKQIFNVADNYLVACFERDIDDEVVTAIAKMQPQYAVLRDTSMATDSTATNFEQIFKTYAPDTVTKVL